MDTPIVRTQVGRCFGNGWPADAYSVILADPEGNRFCVVVAPGG